MEKNELSRITDLHDPTHQAISMCAFLNRFEEGDRGVHDKDYFKRPDNNDLESSSSKHEQHQPNDTKIEIEGLEAFVGAVYKLKEIHGPVSQCCIYKVPKELRKINGQAYTPQVISIGPFHHGNKALVEMEKQKLRYVSEFQQKREGGAEKLKEFKRFIQYNEQQIRNCYQENSSLKSSEFVNMILRDAVFIIQFFLKNSEGVKRRRGFDFFLDTACVKAAIACDLQLLENQLPYLLLQNLFAIYYETSLHEFVKNDRLSKLSHRFFFDPKDGVFLKPKKEIQHFTDLRRYFLLTDFLPRDQKQGDDVRDSPTARDQKQGKHVRDLPTATKLHGSGVKFKVKKVKKLSESGSSSKLHGSGVQEIEGGSSLEISCDYVRAMRIPGFKGCEIPIPFIKELKLKIPGFKGCEIRIPFISELQLQIPRLEIDDRSESLYRNMMALELCHYPSKTHICNFILLMDFLINTEKDVDLFVEQEIILGLLGDNAAVAKMFNNLGLQITPSFSVYRDIGEKLKAHYARPWNRTMATLKTVYFGDVWKGTATVAAFILLLLTGAQTIFSAP
ncbi:hypothetical protein Ddye_018268 [Dipteronia dyeriana]|uniref:Uncharacterized protein n=1 Tax=Dipteronia dyeriana TaxID=168575 RepID=A0AAD9UB30_9ROSI|nr:hypothetical protein Ddye_018268 [Dipteronia dyeriana]